MPPYTGPRGSGFTSLKQYLNLNQDSANALGDSLYGDVASTGQRARDAIDTSRSAFGAQVAAGTPAGFDKGVSTAAEAARLAEAAQYQGPDSWEVSDALLGQTQDASARARALGSDAGRAALLSERNAGNAGYTPGAAGLDAFLAGRGMGERADTARTQWGRMSDYLGAQQQQAAGAVEKAKADTKKTRDWYSHLAGTLAGRERRAEESVRGDAATRAAEELLRRLAPVYRNQNQARGVEQSPDGHMPPDRPGRRRNEDDEFGRYP